MTSEQDYFLDITSDVCPITLVKIKLTLEKMRIGEILSIQLNGDEILKNTQVSIIEMGHTILKRTAKDDKNNEKMFILKIKK